VHLGLKPFLATSLNRAATRYHHCVGQLNHPKFWIRNGLPRGSFAGALKNFFSPVGRMAIGFEKNFKSAAKSLSMELHFLSKTRVILNCRSDVAMSLNNIGSACKDLGETGKALDFFEQALAIYEKLYGKEHPDTKIIKGNLEKILRGASKGPGKGRCVLM